MQAMEKLRERVAELSDLESVQMLAGWDQLVVMPADAAQARAQQLGVLARLVHERATREEIGAWLQEIDAVGADTAGGGVGTALSDVDKDIVRLARRDWERARRVPDEPAVELAQASAAGQESWRVARENDDFASFVPALSRNVELARAYGRHVADEGESVYDALLGDYDYGL